MSNKINNNKTIKALSWLLVGLTSCAAMSNTDETKTGHKLTAGHGGHKAKMGMGHAMAPSCEASDITCAKTVTSAFAPDGKLWRLWTAQQQLFYSISSDNGHHFGEPKKVAIEAEKISSRGENRPKLGFDNNNNVYISWAKPLKGKYTSDVRLTYSTDQGESFAPAQTVNNDGLEIGHSFNEMLVAADGTVTLSWLDGRERKRIKDYQGSALYMAQGKLTKQGIRFNNKKLVDGTCVCCRIAMSYTANKDVAAMWRHIYDDNIRDHAILTFNDQGKLEKPTRASFDQWQLNGCPHQGPGLSINSQNRYHMVWFNNGSRGKGLFYAYSDDSGKNQSKPLSVGNVNAQASYANVMSLGKTVDVVWTEFNGTRYQLYHQRSVDSGVSFATPTVISASTTDADRPFLLQRQGKNYVSWQRPELGHQVIAL
jgi:hypothetical protein